MPIKICLKFIELYMKCFTLMDCANLFRLTPFNYFLWTYQNSLSSNKNTIWTTSAPTFDIFAFYFSNCKELNSKSSITIVIKFFIFLRFSFDSNLMSDYDLSFWMKVTKFYPSIGLASLYFFNSQTMLKMVVKVK